MSQCLYCNKKIAINKVFCSKSCKENYFQYNSMQIPKPFLKRIYIFCNQGEKEKEILKFSERHNYELELLKNKIKKEAIKSGYSV